MQKGHSFSIHVAIDKAVKDEMVVAIVSDPLLVMDCGPADGEGRLTFNTFAVGTVLINILRPHCETLMPGVRTVAVEVVDDASSD